MVAPTLSLAAISLVLSCVMTYAARAYGRRRLLFDSSGAVGQHKVRRTVPNIGGVAIFWAIAAPMLAALGAIWINPDWAAARFPSLAVHLDGIHQQTPMAIGLLGALFTLHVMGLYDDRRPMPAWPKFALMLIVAAAMVIGFDVRLLTMLDAHVGGSWLSIGLTILWLLAVTNAMNFMDNMDGLAAGVGAVAASLFLVTTLINGQWFIAALLALLIGALLGFLVFNAPRRSGATIFMGDGGSLVLGFLLAFLTVRVTYVSPSSTSLGGMGVPPVPTPSTAFPFAVLMPLCILAVPLYDLASVILIRHSQGRSPLVGDRQHFSHRLLAAGLSPPRALAVICGCAAITGIGGIMLSVATGWQAILIGAQVLLVLAVIALYEHGKGWPLSLSRSPREGGGEGCVFPSSPASAGEDRGEGSVSTPSTPSTPRAPVSEPRQ